MAKRHTYQFLNVSYHSPPAPDYPAGGDGCVFAILQNRHHRWPVAGGVGGGDHVNKRNIVSAAIKTLIRKNY